MKKERAGKKNLLIYAHYYIPDTASTGQILRELAESMLDKFNITVICVVPSYLGTIEDKYKTKKYYEEEINGVKVLRIRVPEFSNNETVHDIKYLPKLFMQRMFTKNATDLFACSEEAGKYLFKDKPFQVLKNAIDSQNFIADADTRNEIRKELGLKDKFVVGHVGRLHPQKNHDFLIDVFAEIKKKKPDAELILVATGPLEEKVKSKVVEKGLSDCVHFLGNRKDMNRIYQAMDVFVFPSLFEGLGIVAIEAQAAGVPIVCSEGLPPETDITPIYQKLLLSDGAEKWANVALEMAQNLKAHTNMQQYVIDAGFDMDATAKYMESYYLNRWRTA